MGNPLATDDEIHQALVNSGALEFVRKQKMGLNYIINEGALAYRVVSVRCCCWRARSSLRQIFCCWMNLPPGWMR